MGLSLVEVGSVRQKNLRSFLGLERGEEVEYKGRACTIFKVSGDGTSLTLVDEKDEIHRGVGPEEVKKSKSEKQKKGNGEPEGKERPEKEKTTAPKGDDEGDDEWDDWDN